MAQSDVLVSGTIEEEDLPYSTPWISTFGLAKIALSWTGIEDSIGSETSGPGAGLILSEALTDSGDTSDLVFQGSVFLSAFDSAGVQFWRNEWVPGAPFIQLQFVSVTPMSLPVIYCLRGIPY